MHTQDARPGSIDQLTVLVVRVVKGYFFVPRCGAQAVKAIQPPGRENHSIEEGEGEADQQQS